MDYLKAWEKLKKIVLERYNYYQEHTSPDLEQYKIRRHRNEVRMNALYEVIFAMLLLEKLSGEAETSLAKREDFPTLREGTD